MGEPSKTEAQAALHALLAELPMEFSEPPTDEGRESFRVIKRSNVRTVHEALWTLTQYLASEGEPPATVHLLYDYSDLAGVYADRETAEADRAVLLTKARDLLPGRADAYYLHRVEVIEYTPRTEPRYGPDAPQLSPEDQGFLNEHGGIKPRERE